MRKNKNWNIIDGALFLRAEAAKIELLENAVYHVGKHPELGFYLSKVNEMFTFDYKIYGLETQFINRVMKYYDATQDCNLGILMNGLKGTGKTVTGKIIASKVNQPVIIIDTPYGGLNHFLNSIPQDITIFADEYEKTFKGDHESDMLTIMDGAITSPYRRFFILTTNYLRVDENLLERPSRVRYLKKFTDLSLNTITEIVDDCLEDKQFRSETIDFISKLKKITIDIVKAIITEVNIQEESPFQFGDTFNVEMNDDKVKAYLVEDSGETLIFNNESMNFRKVEFSTNDIGKSLHIGNTWLGNITDVLGSDLLEITTEEDYYDMDDAEEGTESTREAKVMTIRLARSFSTHSSYDSVGNTNRKYSNPEFIDSLFGNQNKKKKAVKMSLRRSNNTTSLLEEAICREPMDFPESRGESKWSNSDMSEDCCSGDICEG